MSCKNLHFYLTWYFYPSIVLAMYPYFYFVIANNANNFDPLGTHYCHHLDLTGWAKLVSSCALRAA